MGSVYAAGIRASPEIVGTGKTRAGVETGRESTKSIKRVFTFLLKYHCPLVFST
jgi:hypothetical protein